MGELRNFSQIFLGSMFVVEVWLASYHLNFTSWVAPEVHTNTSEKPLPEMKPQTSKSYSQGCVFRSPNNFDQLLVEAAKEFDLDPNILAVTVYRESGCDAWAYGSSGEVGLTQVTPKYWLRDLQEQGILSRTQELWDPQTNLRASAWILNTLKKEGLSEYQMFRRYNGKGDKARRYAREQQTALLKLRR